MSRRWTVRGLDADALDLLREVHAQDGVPMGVLLTRAIRVWHASLPESGVARQETRDIGPTVSCDVGYPVSLSDLLQQFARGT